jgi:hypothetical protein
VTLNFTNQSRSYDATRHAVRFWGYDGALEVSFFVTDDALRRLELWIGAQLGPTRLARLTACSSSLFRSLGGSRLDADRIGSL